MGDGGRWVASALPVTSVTPFGTASTAADGPILRFLSSAAQVRDGVGSDRSVLHSVSLTSKRQSLKNGARTFHIVVLCAGGVWGGGGGTTHAATPGPSRALGLTDPHTCACPLHHRPEPSPGPALARRAAPSRTARGCSSTATGTPTTAPTSRLPGCSL